MSSPHSRHQQTAATASGLRSAEDGVPSQQSFDRTSLRSASVESTTVSSSPSIGVLVIPAVIETGIENHDMKRKDGSFDHFNWYHVLRLCRNAIDGLNVQLLTVICPR